MRIRSNPFNFQVRKLRPGEVAYFAKGPTMTETEARAVSPTPAIIRNERRAAGWQVFVREPDQNQWVKCPGLK